MTGSAVSTRLYFLLSYYLDVRILGNRILESVGPVKANLCHVVSEHYDFACSVEFFASSSPISCLP